MVVTLKPFLTQDHAFLCITIFAIALENLITGVFAGLGRRKVFTKDYMRTNFRETHLANFGVGIIQGGYPDMGNGYYSKNLTYKDWYEFNNRQRAHYNGIEHIVAVIPLALIGGIALPLVVFYSGLAYILGRVIYIIGYVRGGPNSRMIGALIKDVGLVGFLVAACISLVRLYNGTV